LKKLKNILKSKYLFKILALIILLFSVVYTNYYPLKSKYDKKDNTFEGIVYNYKIYENKITIYIKAKEKLIINYKYNNLVFNSLSYGDKILVKGTLKEPIENNIPNTFNYKKYLYNKKIYYTVEATTIDKIENNSNNFYTIKNIFYNKIKKLKSSNYIETLLLGNNNLDKEIKESYQTNGISHLFSISGMHINFFISIIYFYLDRVTHHKKIKYIITDVFLILYLILAFSSSLLRSVIMNILFSINNIFKLGIKRIDIMLITLIISLIINPFIIYDTGFIYSYLISFFLILFSKKEQNKIKNIINTTLMSFLVSMPITIYINYEINFISILLNIILIPILTIIIFPLVIITFIFPIFDNILYFFTNSLEEISLYISNIDITKVIFPKPSLFLIIIYYFIIILVLKRKKYFYILIILITIHYFTPYLNNELEIMMFDVGQGDSILIKYPYNQGSILIDTGKSEYTMKNGIIPYLKSRGIKKLKYLIITHGDDDHIGGTIPLVEIFKVDNIILNKGEYSELEINLINNLNKINMINDIDKIKIGKRYIYFLNNKIHENENDNSIVLYFEYHDYKFLFMGDSSFVVEDYLLENYNLKEISFLKVGHHGSSTSTTNEFIGTINPKISLISVGNNNNYGHPSKVVLDNLKDSKIYRTDKQGSINFKIYKTKVKIKKYIQGG